MAVQHPFKWRHFHSSSQGTYVYHASLVARDQFIAIEERVMLPSSYDPVNALLKPLLWVFFLARPSRMIPYV